MRFRELDLFHDRTPHSGSWNMAADEVFLQHRELSRPLLRVYSWAAPSISFGYFQPFGPVEALHPSEIAPVRRWTGGGVVLHGAEDEVTYSLVVPSQAAESRVRARDFYGFVHGCLREVLVDLGFPAVTSGGAESGAAECFRNPVRCDVMVGERKVAGASQKRTRRGLLHQGSIQGVELPPDFPARFAGALAETVIGAESPLEECEDAIEALAAGKYGSDAWLRRY